MNASLSRAGLRSLPKGVEAPDYDPAAIATGIVHIGPGAFHRAHQAAYVDKLLGADPQWGICQIALRSHQLRDALAPQDGLYALVTLGRETRYRVIGAVTKILVAQEDPGAAINQMSAANVRVVTVTVTEKGYCLAPDWGLDFAHPDIVWDLANPHRPRSVIGFLVAALQRRREAGLRPFTVISCDNLPENGVRLKAATIAFAQALDPGLADWIAAQAQFPCTMVDSITPATDDALRAAVSEATGLSDNWPIQREAFCQWVIQNLPGMDGPDWEAAGVTLSDDVAGYEQCKLRLLNGAHSALAYIGLGAGHDTVMAAMSDSDLAAFARALMIEDIIPTLQAPAGLDLTAYADAILERFRNPAIRHYLAQIAWDGSQKLPIRLFPTVLALLENGKSVARPARAVAAWMRFVVQRSRDGADIIDPLKTELSALGRRCNDDPEHDVAAFLALDRVFPADLAQAEPFRRALTDAYAHLASRPG